MEDRKSLIRWIKKHKRMLIGAGISIGVLILVVLGIKNKAALKALWDLLKKAANHSSAKAVGKVAKEAVEIQPEPIREAVSAIASNSEAFSYEVSRHIRNLPVGWHASPEKVAEALKENIILMDGQTWVDSYMKGVVAA